MQPTSENTPVDPHFTRGRNVDLSLDSDFDAYLEAELALGSAGLDGAALTSEPWLAGLYGVPEDEEA